MEFHFDESRLAAVDAAGDWETAADRAAQAAKVEANVATARTIFPGRDPIGERVKVGGTEGPWRTIVGIAGDVRHVDVAVVAVRR